MPTSPPDEVQNSEPIGNSDGPDIYEPYQGILNTPGGTNRQTVELGLFPPVDRLVMKVNVRYPRPNRNNKNSFKDSLY